MAGQRTLIPLFPLGTVLFPGLLLPLNIFEPRYRQLVRDLLDRPDEVRRFGVLNIRHGRETGADSVDALHEVGTTAALSRVVENPDGGYELMTVGADRFRLLELEHSRPYLQGEVELLGDPVGDAAEARSQVPALLASYRAYLVALASSRGSEIELPDLPGEPQLLAWLVAATVVVEPSVRQQLLEARDTTTRLRAEITLLRTETRLLHTVSAAPAPGLTRLPQSPN